VTYRSEYIVIYFTGKLVSCINHVFTPSRSKKTYKRNGNTEQELRKRTHELLLGTRSKGGKSSFF